MRISALQIGDDPLSALLGVLVPLPLLLCSPFGQRRRLRLGVGRTQAFTPGQWWLARFAPRLPEAKHAAPGRICNALSALGRLLT
jgi:hypothetical protein